MVVKTWASLHLLANRILLIVNKNLFSIALISLMLALVRDDRGNLLSGVLWEIVHFFNLHLHVALPRLAWLLAPATYVGPMVGPPNCNVLDFAFYFLNVKTIFAASRYLMILGLGPLVVGAIILTQDIIFAGLPPVVLESKVAWLLLRTQNVVVVHRRGHSVLDERELIFDRQAPILLESCGRYDRSILVVNVVPARLHFSDERIFE